MTDGRPESLRPAATIVLLRERGALETLLLRRAVRNNDLHAGAWVFPGGTLLPADRTAHSHCDGLDDAAASQRLGLHTGGLDFYIAALRECFEEAGLLLATASDGSPLDASALARVAAARAALNRNEMDFAALCQSLELRLAPAALRYFAHWLTPPGLRKRFDTRFFVALAPEQQTASPDAAETMEHRWLTAEEALDRRNELQLARPTYRTLEWLRAHPNAAAALAAADARTEVRRVMPRMAIGASGPRAVEPDDPAWAEIGRLDPHGRGDVSYEFVPGKVTDLSPRVKRVTAPNGNFMTGPGTNSYLIGGGATNEWALLDPGPDDAAHVRALLQALPGTLKWIFVTHTHKDHSPAVQAVKAATGATLIGMRAGHHEYQDLTFQPDLVPGDGQVFRLPGNATLTAIHTPGHASNHFCYQLHEDRLLFTGDHVIQGSTVVISPPDGDMNDYLASLRKLLSLDVDWLAPGHGFLMPEPRQAVRKLIEHRLAREALIVAAWDAGARSLDALRAAVYPDLRPELHGMAQRSILAHLIKLGLRPEPDALH
jgi:glyoxylase-like metal-dependent hydrolase (beta-lactamase superfamily II)/8-oxo-dGTP pyrophosphatase MutT (NUDIX family)